MDPKITLKFSLEEIKNRLKKTFKAEHADVMAECIIGVCSENEHALEVMMKASLGITPKLKFKVGDEISVKKYALSEWRFDVDKMIEENYYNNEHLKCTVETCKEYKYDQYKVKYDYICKDEGLVKSTTSDINTDYIAGLMEEFPADLK
jgi:hypothetical protein